MPLTPTPSDIVAPSGTAISVKGKYFYVKGKSKHLIPTERVLLSQNYPRVVEVTASAANKIPNAVGKVGFRDGTVLKDIDTQYLYLISDNKRRKIVSPDVLIGLGVETTSIIIVSSEEIKLHERGEDIGRL